MPPALLFSASVPDLEAARSPAISDLSAVSPSPYDYHNFDYNRPDFSASMDLDLMSGSIGFPSYSFVGKQRGGTQSLAASRRNISPAYMRTRVAALRLKAAGMDDSRDSLTNEKRSEAARCYGLLHGCANWMALETGKMRIVTYGTGSWCTDDDLMSNVCLEEGDIASNRLFNIPHEGEPLSQELWETIQQSCPLVADCPKPKAWSTTEEHSVYAALPSVLAEYRAAQQALQQSCSACVSLRIASQAAARQTLSSRYVAVV
jgi:hypothetical protein